jgi:hypothetical protein
MPGRPEPGGAGDALSWLLLGQLYFAGLLGALLPGNALLRRPHRAFYVVVPGLVALPFILLIFFDA